MSRCGIDLGGTWIRSVLLDDRGKILGQYKTATPEVPESLPQALLMHWKRHGGAHCVGLASAPELDAHGCIVKWPSRPEFVGVDVANDLLARGVTVRFFDDVSAATIAEHMAFSKGCRRPSSSVVVSVGTGVGGGVVLNDEVWLGKNGRAMDIGHINLDSTNTAVCSCGKTGCIQTRLSGKSLSGTDPIVAANIFRSEIDRIVRLMNAVFDPDRLILIGGVSNWLRQNAFHLGDSSDIEAPVFWGKTGEFSGALGACILFSD